MTPAEAARRIIALLEEGEARGVRATSPDLRAFLDELAASPGLKKPRKKKSTSRRKSPTGKTPRVAQRPKRPVADMSKTIEELARQLRNAFTNQTAFEGVLTDPNTQSLSKANVVTLYNRVFSPDQPLSKDLTKPEIFNAMRRERINRVRGGY